MRSTVRAAVPAATAMYDLADLGYRFTIGPKKSAVSESEPFFPYRESSLTIRSDVDASVCLDEHTLNNRKRYRAVRAPRGEEDSGLDLGSGFTRDQNKESHCRPPHAPTVAAGLDSANVVASCGPSNRERGAIFFRPDEIFGAGGNDLDRDRTHDPVPFGPIQSDHKDVEGVALSNRHVSEAPTRPKDRISTVSWAGGRHVPVLSDWRSS